MAKSPGPGAYSPANASTLKATGKPTSSFTSKTKRLVESLGASAAGDPGSYDPYTLKDLASTSKKSFAKSFRSGSGGFGTRDKRELQIQLTGENTPGAGAYNGGDMMRNGMKGALAAMDTGEKMPSSAFKSKSAQREKSEDNKVPGAGAYSPSFTAIEKKPSNPANSMKAKASRFGKADTFERAQATEPVCTRPASTAPRPCMLILSRARCNPLLQPHSCCVRSLWSPFGLT